ncbi:MAG: DNA mismatch repair endonuclease MutL [Acidobacteriaceae bacterium]|nr:DNA mismatch repair endonuclease MutL [Acidobacteriaceae bacterium]MBV9779606.1 DNA mismatch repair endonuclease MutL [Acidobacteriaceae bacterium]
MGRIRILSDNVANKIAAGEVVERPASVVKELLENALDADAAEVRIDAENAGRRLIRVQDDGCGMLRDDALLAFERHATSKLSDVKDLLAIATLGFRGEALPSIASVSRLVLETRASEEQTGTAVEIAGGKLLRCDEIARPVGTAISVRDLFFNVPARKKFLRSDQTELAHIGSLITHYSLGHCNKRFELYHDGRELLSVTPVSTLRERAFQVFGAEIIEGLIDLGPRSFELPLPPPYVPPNARAALGEQPRPEPAQFVLEGLISGPHVQKLNRNSIFVFVNGRLIRDKVLLHAIQAAYHNLMPPGYYPFALLFLNCDPGEVDVNVHPSKTEVRFRHSSVVHDFVRDAIREFLMMSRPVSSMPLPSSPVIRAEQQIAHVQRAADLPFSEFTATMDLVTAEPELVEMTSPVATEAPEVTITAPLRPFAFEEKPIPEVRPASRRIPETHGALDQLPAGWDRADTFAAVPDLRSLGQLQDSFIVAAGRDGLWIIDQHVAHERILFEQVLRQRAAGNVEIQQLLMPLVLQLTPAQQFEFARIGDELNAHGFEAEPFGQRTIAIKAAPAAVGPSDIESIVVEILEIAESELRSASLDEIRRGVCATIACRAAIKVNTRLEPKKVEWLLRSLAACEYPMTCPHGRPIALRYSMKDILKSFHRI